MFIYCTIHPSYNLDHYSEYETAPEPYTCVYLDGKWDHTFHMGELDDPGYTEEDFNRIIAEEGQGDDSVEYFLVAKRVVTIGKKDEEELRQWDDYAEDLL